MQKDKYSTSSSSQAWWVKSDKSSRNCQNRIQILYSDHCQNQQTVVAKIYNQELNLDCNPSAQQYTRCIKNKMRQECKIC